MAPGVAGSAQRPRLRGTVRFYDALEEYGFIRSRPDWPDVFFSVANMDRGERVAHRDNVTFDLVIEDNGRWRGERTRLIEPQ